MQIHFAVHKQIRCIGKGNLPLTSSDSAGAQFHR
jgi:hypothetical protein